jgi:hypothetical protein
MELPTGYGLLDASTRQYHLIIRLLPPKHLPSLLRPVARNSSNALANAVIVDPLRKTDEL